MMWQSPPMRADAQRHRTVLVEAAARVFIREGYDAPLELVLTESGLGRGTLYRHFANRNALAVAVFELELDRITALVLDHQGAPTMLPALLRHHAAAGVAATAAVHKIVSTGDLRLLEPLRARADVLYEQVVTEAVRLKQVRVGFGAQDLRLVMRMIIAAAGDGTAGSAFDKPEIDVAIDIVMRGIRPT